jgi:hypothetical protein
VSQTRVKHSLLIALMSSFLPLCLVATISLLKLASIIALDGFEGWNQEYQQMKKKEARHASPLVVPMEAAPTLRISCYSVISFRTHGSFCNDPNL